MRGSMAPQRGHLEDTVQRMITDDILDWSLREDPVGYSRAKRTKIKRGDKYHTRVAFTAPAASRLHENPTNLSTRIWRADARDVPVRWTLAEVGLLRESGILSRPTLDKLDELLSTKSTRMDGDSGAEALEYMPRARAKSDSRRVTDSGRSYLKIGPKSRPLRVEVDDVRDALHVLLIDGREVGQISLPSTVLRKPGRQWWKRVAQACNMLAQRAEDE